MGRTPGAKNKNKNIPMPDKSEIEYSDSQDIFLTDVLEKFKFWKAKAKELRKENRNAELEEEYAEAYQMLLTNFSNPDKK